MSVAFLCENKNSLRLLKNGFRSEVIELSYLDRFALLTCDWTNTILNWVSNPVVFFDGKERFVKNIFEDVDAFLQEGLLKAPDKFSQEQALQSIYLSHFKKNNYKLVVLFNDASVRGKPFALAAKQAGLPVFLIQDGHLNFESKTNCLKQTDQNFNYGATKPTMTYVWGSALQEKLTSDHKIKRSKITIAGKIAGFHPSTNEVARHPENHPPRKYFKILFADQPLIDQGKMDRAAWKKEFKEFISDLGQFNVTIKLHPSTVASTRDMIKELVGNQATIDEENFVDGDYIKRFDIVLTFFSTIYLDSLTAGVPIIFHNLPSCDIMMPEMKHPLIANTYSIESLIGILEKYRDRDQFTNNSSGELLNHYIEQQNAEYYIAKDIKSILNGEFKCDFEPLTKPSNYKKTSENISPLSIEYINTTSEAPKSILILGTDFSYKTGVAYPITNYANYMKSCGGANIKFLQVKTGMDPDYIINYASKFSYIIINSLAFFFRYNDAATVANSLKNKFLYVYAHETAYTIQEAKKEHRLRFDNFSKIARGLFYLCVSQSQKDLFISYGWTKAVTIYNCIDISDHLVKAKSISKNNDETKKIIMIGSVQERKGVELFSRVADTAHKLGLPYKFMWVGGLTPKISPTTQLSDHIQWLGHKEREEALKIVQESDAYFLSSIDDPFPLSLLEAAFFNKRIISYLKVGSYEAFSGVKGYQNFDRYEPNSALEAINKVFEIPDDKIQVSTVIRYFLPSYFAARLNIVLKQYRHEAINYSKHIETILTQKFVPDAMKLVHAAYGNLDIPPLKDPGHSRYSRTREDAYIALRHGDYDTAESIFIDLIGGRPHAALPYIDLAALYKRQKKFVLAYKYYTEALKRNPSSEAARKNIKKYKKLYWLHSIRQTLLGRSR